MPKRDPMSLGPCPSCAGTGGKWETVAVLRVEPETQNSISYGANEIQQVYRRCLRCRGRGKI
jgi:hypothetical protein